MDKTYVKIFAVGFVLLGAWTVLDAVMLLTTTSEYISIPYDYDAYGRLLYMEVYNDAYPMAYFDVAIGFVELIVGILMWPRTAKAGSALPLDGGVKCRQLG